MPNISGSFTATIVAETTVTVPDTTNHQLQLSEVRATQKSPDPDWNNSRLTYHGVADLLSGAGPQRGYFVNEHPDGNRDSGTFEGKVTTTGSEITLEGTFEFTAGTGRFKGIRGGGSYKGRLVSPTQIEMSWSGSYEVAAAAGRVA